MADMTLEIDKKGSNMIGSITVYLHKILPEAGGGGMSSLFPILCAFPSALHHCVSAHVLCYTVSPIQIIIRTSGGTSGLFPCTVYCMLPWKPVLILFEAFDRIFILSDECSCIIFAYY